MKQPLVSIILPTYNVERFLRECLESINRQTYKNIEVIIIIDGATDGSYEIAKEYCESHPKFSLYWQENQGSGPARNNGISHATGELVAFVDPDDWCEPSYIEELVAAQGEGDYDLVLSRDKIVHQNGDGSQKVVEVLPLSKKQVVDLDLVRRDYVMLLENNLVRAPHGKIYKRSIIVDNNVEFPALRRSQDIGFNILYYTHVKSYCTCATMGYVYRVLMDEKLSKLKPEYSETISLLYEWIGRMFRSWDCEYDVTRVANFFYSVLYGYLCFLKGDKKFIKSKLSEGSIFEIVATSNPTRIDRVFTRSLLLNKQYTLASWYFKILSHFYK